jgi:DNA-binding helix-hairpin-helix protein with protein kinase domain
MPTWTYIVGGLVAGLGPFVTALVLLRKAPAEAREINVRIAGDLRDGAVEDWQRARDDLAGLRDEFEQYRADTDARMAEMAAELRAEKAEKQAVKAENDRLRRRVDELEDEVAGLKAGRA